MKRTRRHKFLKVAVFFLIYSVITVLSKDAPKSTENKLKEPEFKVKLETKTEIPTTQASSTLEPTSTTPSNVITRPTLRPKRNCTPPAIEQVINSVSRC